MASSTARRIIVILCIVFLYVLLPRVINTDMVRTPCYPDSDCLIHLEPGDPPPVPIRHHLYYWWWGWIPVALVSGGIAVCRKRSREERAQ